MRRRFARGSWLLVGLLFIGFAAGATAQTRIVPPVSDSADQIDGVLRRAQKHEVEQRWGEALSVYEEALHEHPAEPTLTGRHTLAKIHYDLGRRYGDSSFLRTISTLSEKQALSLYSEVLVKIESHYVTSPDWAQLVARGTQGLTIALSEKPFQRQNLHGARQRTVRGLCQPIAAPDASAARANPRTGRRLREYRGRHGPPAVATDAGQRGHGICLRRHRRPRHLLVLPHQRSAHRRLFADRRQLCRAGHRAQGRRTALCKSSK